MLFFTKYANIYLTQSFLKTPENKKQVFSSIK